jgi:hypothetical protein
VRPEICSQNAEIGNIVGIKGRIDSRKTGPKEKYDLDFNAEGAKDAKTRTQRLENTGEGVRKRSKLRLISNPM